MQSVNIYTTELLFKKTGGQSKLTRVAM